MQGGRFVSFFRLVVTCHKGDGIYTVETSHFTDVRQLCKVATVVYNKYKTAGVPIPEYHFLDMFHRGQKSDFAWNWSDGLRDARFMFRVEKIKIDEGLVVLGRSFF